MTDPSNPLTEPKRLPSRGKRATAGLLATCLGIGAWALFFLINSLIHVRLLPLPVIGLILIAAGLYHAFARDDGGAATSNQNKSQP